MSPTWEEFLARHAQAVLDAALRVVAHAADAEDVAQDVFMEILQGGKIATLFDQPALVRTMSTRRALDRLRKRRSLDSLHADEPLARQHEPVDHLIAHELERRLQCEVAKLPPREAEVFCLTYFEEIAPIEIALALQISTSAVAKHLSMARKKLATAFERKRQDTTK